MVAQEKTVTTEPKEVTVYLQSAKVTERGTVNLSNGKNILKVTNLSNHININTYRIGLSNRATLLSVTPSTNYLKADDFSKEEQLLRDQQEIVQLELKFKEAEEQSLAGELRLIEENRKIGNTETGWTTEQLASLASYYAKRTLEINKKRIVLQTEITKIKEELSKINKQLTETRTDKNQNRQELLLEVDATRAMSTTVDITYIVSNAGWQPFYDIRAASLNDPLELITKGKVYQNTGKDWTNVAMEVSTYLPKSNQNRPILNPFYIKEYQPQNNNGYGLEEVVVTAESTVNSLQMRKDSKALEDVPVTAVVEQQFNVIYGLNAPQSVTSSGKGQTLILDKKTIEAEYKYHAVPKLTEEVFLLANIKNWQTLNLLLTEANIYFEDNFIGKTTINPNYTKDEYPLSLGVDERIIIKRRLIDNLTTKRTLSSKKIDAFAFEIKIRNNGPKAIELEILDQLPISQNNKIDVDVLELAGGDYDADTGSILWTKNIARGGNELFTFKYEVTYPKDMELQYY